MMKFQKEVTILMVLVGLMIVSCKEEVGFSCVKSYKMPYNLNVDVENETAVIIRNQEDFDIFFGNVRDKLEKIDFNSYSLLYVQGTSANAVTDIKTFWYQEHSPDQLTILIENDNFLSEYREWCVGFLLQKEMAEDVNVKVLYSSDSHNQ